MLERIARDRVATLFFVTLAVLLAVGAAAPGFLSARTASVSLKAGPSSGSSALGQLGGGRSGTPTSRPAGAGSSGRWSACRRRAAR